MRLLDAVVVSGGAFLLLDRMSPRFECAATTRNKMIPCGWAEVIDLLLQVVRWHLVHLGKPQDDGFQPLLRLAGPLHHRKRKRPLLRQQREDTESGDDLEFWKLRLTHLHNDAHPFPHSPVESLLKVFGENAVATNRSGAAPSAHGMLQDDALPQFACCVRDVATTNLLAAA